MPHPAVIALGVIGGGLVAVKLFDKGDNADKMSEEQGQNNGVNVGANADQIGYERISQSEYEAQGGVEAGQVADVHNPVTGERVGTVVGLEGGNQVFQDPQGNTRLRTSDDEHIEVTDPGIITNGTGSNPLAGASAVGKTVSGGSPITTRTFQAPKPAPVKAPTLKYKKPKKPVSKAVQDARIRASARAGLRFPM